jgi:hypothetical protein
MTSFTGTAPNQVPTNSDLGELAYLDANYVLPTAGGTMTGAITFASGQTIANLASGSAGTIPYQTASGTTAMLAAGTSGQVLTSNGASAPTWATASGSLQSSPGIVTTNYTALSNNLIRANSTAGTFTITLPDSPNDGDVVGIIDVANTFGTNPVTVVPGTIGTIESTNSIILDLDGAYVSFVFIASGVNNWKLEQTPTGPSSGSAGLTISNSQIISRVTTTNATPTVLTVDGAAPTANNQLILSNDSTYTFSILVTARRTDLDNESAGYKFEGVIDRNNTAATTNFVISPIKTILAEDSTIWDCNLTADTTNGGLAITATGEVNKTIKWVAVCSIAAVTG